MIGLIRSEGIKTFATKAWWILCLIGIGLTALASLPILLVSNLGDEIPELQQVGPELVDQVWASMGAATVIPLIIGILAFTGEYRHETITDTFLTEPRRAKVIAAKAAINALLGVIFAVLASLTVVGLALWLLPDGLPPIDWGAVGQTALAVALTFALYAVLGVSVGALITNQIAAVVLGILWVLLLESLIGTLRPEIGKWLPGGAAQSILGSGSPDGQLLAPGLAVIVLIGYTVALAAIAGATTLRRDIT